MGMTKAELELHLKAALARKETYKQQVDSLRYENSELLVDKEKLLKLETEFWQVRNDLSFRNGDIRILKYEISQLWKVISILTALGNDDSIPDEE